jgi:transporter family protein
MAGKAGSLGGMNWLPWALLSAAFAGATAVLAKTGVEDIDSNLATAVRTTVVLVFAWGVALLTNPPSALTALPRRAWLYLLLSGLATGLSWLCYFRALKLGPVAKVAPVDKLSVVFVLVFAAVFLGEPLTWRTGFGGALITAGAVMLAWR